MPMGLPIGRPAHGFGEARLNPKRIRVGNGWPPHAHGSAPTSASPSYWGARICRGTRKAGPRGQWLADPCPWDCTDIGRPIALGSAEVSRLTTRPKAEPRDPRLADPLSLGCTNVGRPMKCSHGVPFSRGLSASQAEERQPTHPHRHCATSAGPLQWAPHPGRPVSARPSLWRLAASARPSLWVC